MEKKNLKFVTGYYIKIGKNKKCTTSSGGNVVF